MTLKTNQLRSLIDPNKTILTFENDGKINISMFHHESRTKQLFIVLNKRETQQLIATLQSYVEEKLPERGTLTNDEILEKAKRIL